MSLSKNEQKIYELLKNRELYRNEKGIFTMCPQRLLIRLSGKGERTVQYALKNLEKQGYIHREWLAKEHLYSNVKTLSRRVAVSDFIIA